MHKFLLLERLRLMFFWNRKRQHVTWLRACRQVCRLRFTFPRQDLLLEVIHLPQSFLLLNHCQDWLKACKIILSCFKIYNFAFMVLYSKFSWEIMTSDSSDSSGIKQIWRRAKPKSTTCLFSGFPNENSRHRRYLCLTWYFQFFLGNGSFSMV